MAKSFWPNSTRTVLFSRASGSSNLTAVVLNKVCSSSANCNSNSPSSKSSPSSVHNAWKRARAFSSFNASSFNEPPILLSPRSTSNRCAMSRCHPLGCERIDINSPEDAVESFADVLGFQFSGTIRQMRPRWIGRSNFRLSVCSRRYGVTYWPYWTSPLYISATYSAPSWPVAR